MYMYPMSQCKRYMWRKHNRLGCGRVLGGEQTRHPPDMWPDTREECHYMLRNVVVPLAGARRRVPGPRAPGEYGYNVVAPLAGARRRVPRTWVPGDERQGPGARSIFHEHNSPIHRPASLEPLQPPA